MDIELPKLGSRLLRHVLPWTMAAAFVVAGATACSDDEGEAEPPGATSIPDPAPGAADGVVDGSEDGKDLTEDLNVPGSEAEDEVDDE